MTVAAKTVAIITSIVTAIILAAILLPQPSNSLMINGLRALGWLDTPSAEIPIQKTPLDAATLSGKPGLFYLQAKNLIGVISPENFSAYDSLVSEGKIDSESVIYTDKNTPTTTPVATDGISQSELDNELNGLRIEMSQEYVTAIEAGLGLSGGGGAGETQLSIVPGEGIIIQNDQVVAILGDKVDLLTEVAGVLSIANGGTGLSVPLPAGKILTSTGSGYASGTLAAGDGITVSLSGNTFTYQLDGTVCRTSGNCSGSGGSIVGGGAAGQLAFFTDGTTLSSSAGLAWNTATSRLTVTGSVNSTSGYLVNGVNLNTSHVLEGANLYYTQARFDTAFGNKTTSNLTEGTGLYWTNARFDSRLATKSTSDLTEGTRLYYTDVRVSANVDVAANTAARHNAATILDSSTLNLSLVGQQISGSVIQSGLQTSLLNNDAGFIANLTGFDSDDLAEGTTNWFFTSGRFDTALSGKDSDDISEGTINLYFTTSRFDTAFAGKDTDDLAEGTTNQFFTAMRFDTAFSFKSTSDLAEGANLYYTETRVSANTDVAANTAVRHAAATITDTTTIDLVLLGQNISANVIQANLQTSLLNNDAGFITGLGSFDSDDLAEGSTNQYFTGLRFDTSFSGKSTDDLTEGIANLYFSDALVSANADVAANTLARHAAATVADSTTLDLTLVGQQITGTIIQSGIQTSLLNNDAGFISSFSLTGYDTDDLSEGATNKYWSQALFDAAFGAKSTSNLAEGTNLYYTQARFDTAFAGKDADDLAEGTTNKYFTTVNFDAAFGAKDSDDLPEGVVNLYYTTARFDTDFATKDTDDLTEGTKKFYSDALFGASLATRDSDDIVQGATNLYFTQGQFDTAFGTKTTDGLTQGSTNLYSQWANNTTNITFGNSVGIGAATAPTATLDVTGTLKVSGAITLSSMTTNGGILYTNGSGVVAQLSVGGSGQCLVSNGSGSAPSWAGCADAGTLTGTGSAGQLAYFSSANSLSGSASLAWNDVDSQFEVNGDVDITGGYLVNGSPITTDEVTEGTTALYWTNARFDSRLATKDTDDLAEGTNLYYTDSRVSANTDVAANTAARHSAATISDSSTLDLSIVGQQISGSVIQSGLQTSLLNNDAGFITSISLASFDTDDLAEGTTNKYFSDALFGTSLATRDTDDLAEGVANLYYTTARFDTAFNAKSTTNLAEGTNLYWTQLRFDNAFTAKDTDDLSEGLTNLYYTQGRFDTSFATKDTDDLTEGTTALYWTNTRFDSRLATKTTADIAENTSYLYYTDTRVSANTDVTANTAARHAAATILDSTTLDLALVGQQISGSVIQSGLQTSLLNNDAGFVANLSSFDTDNLTEGTTNLYWTNARFDTQLATKDSDDIVAGTTNLYSQWANNTTNITFGNSVGIGAATAPTATLDVTGTVKVSGGLTLSSLTTDGGILYTNSSGLVAQTAAGGLGQCLKSNGGGAPTWGSCATSSAITGSGVAGQISFFDSSSSIAGDTGLTWNSTTDTLSVNGSISMTGNIIPSVNDTYSLGSATYMWQDVYIGPGSLYINGQKVLQDMAGTIVVSADLDQNLQLKTAGAGDLELSTATGTIQFKGNVQVNSGKTITSSDGLPIQIPSGLRAGNVQISGNTIATTNLNGDIAFTPNGAGDSYFTSGNLGVGNSNPGYRLDVTGSINASTGYLLNGVALSTTNIAEGTNLYYTQGRFDTSFATKDTDDLTEGTTALYWTDGRFDSRLATKSTSNLTEGTNLYYTDVRVSANSDVVANTAARHAAATISDSSTLDLSIVGQQISGSIIQSGIQTSLVNNDAGFISSISLAGFDTDDLSEGATNKYWSQALFDAAFGAKSTTNLAEGTNLYYTTARFNTDFATKDADDLAEGTTNKYFTTVNFDAAFNTKDSDDLTEGVVNLYYTSGRFDADFATKDTDDLGEGTANKYYSDALFGTSLALRDSDDIAQGATNLYFTQGNFDTAFSGKTTDDLTEGITALYWTNARFDSRLSTKSTTDLAEGTNLYYTDTRVSANADVAANTAARHSAATVSDSTTLDLTIVGQQISGSVIQSGLQTSLFNNDAGFVANLSTFDTDDLAEGTTNQFYSSTLFNTDFATKDTDDLAQGSTNLYSQWANNTTNITFGNSVGIGAATAPTATLDITGTFKVSGAITLSNYTTNGGILYTNGTGVVAQLSAGGSGQCLVSNGAGAAPSWAGCAESGTLTGSGNSGELAYFSSGSSLSGSAELVWNSVASAFEVAGDIDVSGGYLVDGLPITTDNVAEGTALYWTNARFDSRLATKSTTDLSEGTNLYYTDVRVSANTDVAANTAARHTAATITDSSTLDLTLVGQQISGSIIQSGLQTSLLNNDAGFVANLSTFDTDDLAEGSTNKYYADSLFAASLATRDADDIAEGATNKYFTTVNFDAALGTKSTSNLSEGANLYYTQARFDTAFDAKDSDDLSEGIVNLYYTPARFNTDFATKDTDDLTEGTKKFYSDALFGTSLALRDSDDIAQGSTNLYFSQGNFDTAFDGKTTDNLTEGTTALYWTNARFDSRLATKSTTDLSEGTNLYYTDTRVSANTDVAANTAARHSAASISDSTTLDLSIVGQQISGSVIQSGLQTSLLNNDAGFVANLSTFDTDDLNEGATNKYWSQALFDVAFGAKSTTNLTEGTNLYYTQARFDTAFSGKSTTNLSEGTNLYWTALRFDTAFDAKDSDDLTEGVVNLYYTTARFDTDFATKDTDDLTEGTKKFYSDALFGASLALRDSDDLAEGATNLYYSEAKVSANVDVAANTAARHNAATVLDTGIIDMTISGQQISATIVADSLDFSDLSDTLSLDASTSIALGSNTLSTSGTGGITFGHTGTTTYAGTVTSSGLLTASNGFTLSSGALSLPANAVTDAMVSNTLTSSIFIGSGSTSNAVDLGTGEVSGQLAAANIANDSLDFDKLKDALTLDASTDIALGVNTLSSSGSGALAFNHTGDSTFTGNVGIGVDDALYPLHIESTQTPSSGSVIRGLSVDLDAAPTANMAGSFFQAGLFSAKVPTGSTFNLGAVIGTHSFATNEGSGNVSSLTGSRGSAYSNVAAAVSRVSGLMAESSVSAGSVTEQNGLFVDVASYGGNITSQAGISIGYMWNDGGTVANRYGIWIKPFNGSATSSDYAIYSQATQSSYLAGGLSLGGSFTSAGLLTASNGLTLSAGTLSLPANSVTDAMVSNTLTASIFAGSGSTTNAVDLGTAEVAGTLANSNLTGSGALTVTAGSGLTGGGSIALGGSASVDIGAGTGISVAADAVALDYSATLAGNPTLSASQGTFASTGLIFEGSTADTNETLLTFANPTADRTITFPNATGTVAVSASGNIALSAAGAITFTGTLGVANGGTGVASITGLVKGNGTSAFSAATAGTDYSAGTSALGTGILKTTTGTGALSIAVAGDFPTLNQNTTGTAANVTGTVAVANGGTGQTSLQAAINSLSGLTTNGDLLYHNGTNATRLARGADGQCLTSTTTGIQWGSCGGGGSSLFTDGGTFTYLTATTDDLVLGSNAIATGSLYMDVSAGDLFVGTDGSLDGSINFYSQTVGKTASIYTDVSGNLNLTSASGSDVVVGGGNGNIGLQLSDESDVLTADKTVSVLTGNYSLNDFTFERSLTGSAYNLNGKVLSILDSSSSSSTINPDMLYINAVPSSGTFTGNLINAQVASVSKFIVDSNGAMTASGLVTASNGLTLSSGTLTLPADSITDAMVSNTLTASIFIGSGSSTNAVDLGTAEVNGTLGVANGGTGQTTAQAAINSLSGLTTNGDLLYHNGTNATRLARGTDGQCLTSNTTTVAWGACNAANTVTGTGVSGQISFWNGTNTQAGDADFVWDNTNKRLGLGIAAPDTTLHVDGTTTITQGLYVTGGNAGVLLSLASGGTSIFTVTDTQITATVPVSFQGSGNMSVANDLEFTNGTQANITTAAPLQITAGEVFNSSNITLKTYNSGTVVIDSASLTTTGSVTIASGLTLTTGTLSLPAGAVAGSAIAADSLDFTHFADTLTLDVPTTITLGSNTLTFGGTAGITFGQTGTTSFSGGNVVIGSGSDTITMSSAGMVLAGTARPTKVLTISPEFQNSAFITDGSVNTDGNMISENTGSANAYRNYYEWTSSQATLQDYTIAVRITLPQDFDAWDTTGFSLSYQTGTSNTADNAVSAQIFETSQTTAACDLTTDQASTTWTTTNMTCAGATLNDGTNDWDTAGQTAIIKIKVKAKNTASALARVGDIVLQYKAKF